MNNDYLPVYSYGLADGTFSVSFLSENGSISGVEVIRNANVGHCHFSDGVLDLLVYGHRSGAGRELVSVNIVTANGKSIAQITD